MKKKILILVISLLVLNILLITPIGTTLTVNTIGVFNNVYNYSKEKIEEFNKYFIDNKNSQKELEEYKINNQKLLEELEYYKNQNILLKNENQDLKNNLNLNDNNYQIVNGKIIKKNNFELNDKGIINLGTNNGINKGMPVVANGILIGIVSDVEENQAHINYISNYINGKISMMAIENDQTKNVILTGYNSEKNELIVRTIDSSMLNVGETIYTGQFDPMIPKGIKIGTVKEKKINNETNEIEYIIDPTINYYNVEYIGVIING